MSEERTGEEVTMDEYMKVVDYDPNGDRVVENALNATNCNFAAEAANASKLGDRSAADYALKSDLTGFQDTVSTAQTTANNAQTTANNAQTSATQAQETATEAAVTAAEAKCTATAAQTTANEAKTGLNSKVDKIAGKQLSTNDYTTAEKTKLEGIEAGANKYTHPPKHPASMIEGLPEIAQETGPSTTAVMSQSAVTTALSGKVAKVNGNGPNAEGDVKVSQVARTYSLTGDVTGKVDSYDGSTNFSMSTKIQGGTSFTCTSWRTGYRGSVKGYKDILGNVVITYKFTTTLAGGVEVNIPIFDIAPAYRPKIEVVAIAFKDNESMIGHEIDLGTMLPNGALQISWGGTKRVFGQICYNVNQQ